MTPRLDAAVVGAGPNGLAARWALRQVFGLRGADLALSTGRVPMGSA